MTQDWAWREDLLQEALVHLWQQETSRPGQCRSWYLQNCKFYLQNFLRHGRSIDSPGRRHRSGSAVVGDDGLSERLRELGEVNKEAGVEESAFLEISARDMVCSLSQQLAAKERTTLSCLADGQGPREIARTLAVSHTSVIRRRRKIAALAIKLGIAPLPQKPPTTRKANGVLHLRLRLQV